MMKILWQKKPKNQERNIVSAPLVYGFILGNCIQSNKTKKMKMKITEINLKKTTTEKWIKWLCSVCVCVPYYYYSNSLYFSMFDNDDYDNGDDDDNAKHA